MAYGDQMGGRSVTTIYKREQDKLSNEFIAKEKLTAGTPVVLNTDGTISEAYFPGGTAKPARYLGINLYDVPAGALTTVMILISHVMVYGESADTVNVGDLVTVTSQNGNPSLSETDYDYRNHLGITTTSQGEVANGLCLDSDAIGTELRVLIFDTPRIVE